MTHHHDHDALVGGLAGLAVGWLIFDGGRPRPVGHQHGEYWHTHEMPRGYHVHDGAVDGPIRLVPPTPEQAALLAARRARSRSSWVDFFTAMMAIIGLAVASAGGAYIVGGLLVMATAGVLSPTCRAVVAALRAPDEASTGTATLDGAPQVEHVRQGTPWTRLAVDDDPDHVVVLTDIVLPEDREHFSLSGVLRAPESWSELTVIAAFKREGRTVGLAHARVAVTAESPSPVTFGSVMGYQWSAYDDIRFSAHTSTDVT